MKKLLSCVLALTIILNCTCIDVSATTVVETSAISIDEIPLDWEGWYYGFSAGSIKRGAEIHINSIKPDGSIIK